MTHCRGKEKAKAASLTELASNGRDPKAVSELSSIGGADGIRTRGLVTARDGTGVTMAEVSGRIGLHTSTIFHLLRRLTSLGYLVQDETTRGYHLGSKVFQLAASVWPGSNME